MDDQRIDKIETKLDRLDGRLDDICIQLTRNTDELAHHIERTNKLENELLPIRQHVARIEGFSGILTKILAVISTLLGLAWIIQRLFFFT